MKNLLVIGLLCLTFFAGQEIFAQETKKSEPTLDETMSWLQTKFRAFSSKTFMRGEETSETPNTFTKLIGFKGNSVEFKNCKMSFETDYESSQYLYLKDVDASRLKVIAMENDSSFDIEFYSNNMEPKFSGLSKSEYYSGTYTTKALTKNRIRLRFSNEDTADRIVKALKFAIKQCGGSEEKEPF